MPSAAKVAVFCACAAVVALIGWADYATGIYLSLSIFLLVPIWAVAWYVGEHSGYVIGALASIASFFIDSNIYPPEVPMGVIAWNFSSKTAFFMLFAMLVARQRASLYAERAVASRDALTGIATRRVLFEHLEHEIAGVRRSHRPLALAYIDLDNFKAVNDERGHAAGDAALVLVADTIRSHIRDTELLARLGGDEFAVVMHGTTVAGARKATERLRETLLEAMRAQDLPITFSIGVFVYDGSEPATAESLIRTTDALMYDVKHSTKDAVRVQQPPADYRIVA